MISTALLLVRTSLVRVLFLAAALMTLATVWSGDPPEAGDPEAAGLAAALAAGPRLRAPSGDPPPALRIALFDPERRPETVSGSIDDLRGIVAPPPPAANITLTGVLLNGQVRRAMLGVAGGTAAWNAVGAEVGGWHLARVDAEGAVLERDGRSLALKVADRLKARTHPRGAPDGGDAAAPGAGPPGAPPGAVPADTLMAPDPVDPPKP